MKVFGNNLSNIEIGQSEYLFNSNKNYYSDLSKKE